MPYLVGAWILGIFVSIATDQPPRVWPGALALGLATLAALLGGVLVLDQRARAGHAHASHSTPCSGHASLDGPATSINGKS